RWTARSEPRARHARRPPPGTPVRPARLPGGSARHRARWVCPGPGVLRRRADRRRGRLPALRGVPSREVRAVEGAEGRPVIQDLFEDEARDVALAPGAVVLGGFARRREAPLMAALQRVVKRAPFRHMITPGGHRMSIAMTSCGTAGWVTDRTGYRYDGRDPESGRPWPPMPAVFAELAREAAARAGFDGFDPDSCLINRY